MQDTKNLIRKRDITYLKLIREAQLAKNDHRVQFWTRQLETVTKKIEERQANQKKNLKQQKKKR